MKKLLIVLAFAGISAAAAAQDSYNEEKYRVATNKFWHNWFVQGGVSWNAWYGNYEDGRGLDKSPFKAFRSSPAVSLALGKWFTPSLALRTKLSGVWGKAVFGDDAGRNENKYWMLNEQALFNLNNMFGGYDDGRTWSLIPFFGVGVARSCTYNRYGMGVSAGLINEFRINRKLAVNIEIGWNRYESDVCGMPADMGKGVMDHPNNVYAEIGVTYRIGRSTWEKMPDMETVNELAQSQIDALNAMLADERADNERLRSESESSGGNNGGQAVATADTTAAVGRASVFFNINEATITSGKDLVDVKQLADYAIAAGATVVVTGYADSATGSAEFNSELSRRRAETVAGELVKMGVKKENIKTVAQGGVDTLVPPSYNRRAIVDRRAIVEITR